MCTFIYLESLALYKIVWFGQQKQSFMFLYRGEMAFYIFRT